MVARRDKCGLSAGVLLFVDGVSRSCQESIPPASPRREGFQPDN